METILSNRKKLILKGNYNIPVFSNDMLKELFGDDIYLYYEKLKKSLGLNKYDLFVFMGFYLWLSENKKKFIVEGLRQVTEIVCSKENFVNKNIERELHPIFFAWEYIDTIYYPSVKEYLSKTHPMNSLEPLCSCVNYVYKCGQMGLQTHANSKRKLIESYHPNRVKEYGFPFHTEVGEPQPFYVSDSLRYGD